MDKILQDILQEFEKRDSQGELIGQTVSVVSPINSHFVGVGFIGTVVSVKGDLLLVTFPYLGTPIREWVPVNAVKFYGSLC